MSRQPIGVCRFVSAFSLKLLSFSSPQCCAYPWDPGARACGCTPKAFRSVWSGGVGLCRPLRPARRRVHGFNKGVFGDGGFPWGRHRAIRARRAWLPSEESTMFHRFAGAPRRISADRPGTVHSRADLIRQLGGSLPLEGLSRPQARQAWRFFFSDDVREGG
jgi:hypothetical protein